MRTVATRLRTIGLLGAFCVSLTALHLLIVERGSAAVNAAHLHHTPPVWLTMTDGKDFVNAGDSLVYAIALHTDRPTPQYVDVYLKLPPQTNLKSASDSGRLEGRTVVWRHVAVFNKEPRRIQAQISVDPYAHPDFLLVAHAGTDWQAVSDATKIAARGPKYGSSAAAVSLSVSDGKSYASPNEILTYKISVANREPHPRRVQLRANLPKFFELHKVSGNHRKTNRAIIWQLDLAPNEARDYYVRGQIERGTPDYAVLNFNVVSGARRVTDSTSVTTNGQSHHSLVVSITDDKNQTVPGDTLRYRVLIENTTSRPLTNLDLNANVPAKTEFLGADQGGYWNGSTVYWKNLTVAPGAVRTLQYSVRVRPDVRPGHRLVANALARGNKAVDVTELGNRVVTRDRVVPRAPRAEIAQAQSWHPHERTLRRQPTSPYVGGPRGPKPPAAYIANNSSRGHLRSSPSRREVYPGDIVKYQVRFRNPTRHSLRNVRVADTFDSNHIRVIDPRRGTAQGNTMQWNIPLLQPGQEWVGEYQAQVASTAPHGMFMANTARAYGSGVEHIPANNRYASSHVGVMTQFPQTGADFDQWFIIISGLLTFVGISFARQKILL